jgi:hypothetical protein
MTSGSLTRDKDPEGDLGGGGVTPFLGEEAVHDGLRSNLSLGTLTHYG